jgi:hypothetical protein
MKLPDSRPRGIPRPSAWGIRFMAMFHMANDSGLFRTRKQLEDDGFVLDGNVFRRGPDTYLPLYEAKMVHQFDHRWATYEPEGDTRDMTDEEKANPFSVAMPRYWVPTRDIDDRLQNKWDRHWLLGWRDITSSTNERTIISTIFPAVAVGNKIPLMMVDHHELPSLASLQANLTAFVYDFASRQKVGGTTLNFFIYKQLPVLAPDRYETACAWDSSSALNAWIAPRVLELTCTASDMQPFARDLGYDGPPFLWDPERRFLIRCELDAAFFLLYGIERDDVGYIMETFPIVKRKDEARHASYRMKETILHVYDSMQKSIETSTSYVSPVEPKLGDPSCAHSVQSIVGATRLTAG